MENEATTLGKGRGAADGHPGELGGRPIEHQETIGNGQDAISSAPRRRISSVNTWAISLPYESRGARMQSRFIGAAHANPLGGAEAFRELAK